MQGRSFFIPSILLLSYIGLVTACQPPVHEQKKIFRYNESSGVTSLDPLKATNLANIWVVNQLYEGLTCIDSNGTVQPMLARSWFAEDNATCFYFLLKPGIFFHEDDCFAGKKRELTVNDVIYTFERTRKNPSTAWVLENVAVDTLKDRMLMEARQDTLVVHLKEPMPHFPQMLAMPFCGIVPKEAVDTYGDDFRRHPVGTGPFILKAWYENEKMVMHKNPAYHTSGLPKIDGISVSFLKDKQTVLLEFIRGRFDLISGIDAAYKDELLTGEGSLNPLYDPYIRLTRQPYLNTEYLGFLLDDPQKGPLSNLHIRKALNYGVDRKKLIRYLRNGIGIPGEAGLVPPVLYGKNKAPVGYSFNKELFYHEIKLAGYTHAAEVPEIVLHTDVAYTDICTYLAHEWNELGLHIKLDVMDRPTLKSETAKGNLGFFRASWIADYPDPENYLSLLYGPFKSPAGPNYTHYNDDGYNRLFETRLRVTNDSLRNHLYGTLDSLMLQEAPVLVLFYDQAVRFTQKRIKGLPPHPMNYLDLKRVDMVMEP